MVKDAHQISGIDMFQARETLHRSSRKMAEFQLAYDVLLAPTLAAPPLELAAAGVELGTSYPEPIVDHPMARERVLAAYKEALGR